MTEETQTEETQVEEGTSASASLSINDLATVVNIIDVCSKRGAFKPSEMETVGRLYNTLVGFLVDAGVIKTSEEQEAPADDTEEETQNG